MKKFYQCVVMSIAVMGTSMAMNTHAEISIVVHPSNSVTLDKKALSKIFLGKSKSFPGGGTAIPVNIKEGSAVTDEFNDKVLGKNSAQLKSYWSKLVFTGKGSPPKEVDSEQDVIDLVKSNPAVIGFVSSGALADGVKVVGTF